MSDNATNGVTDSSGNVAQTAGLSDLQRDHHGREEGMSEDPPWTKDDGPFPTENRDGRAMHSRLSLGREGDVTPTLVTQQAMQMVGGDATPASVSNPTTPSGNVVSR